MMYPRGVLLNALANEIQGTIRLHADLVDGSHPPIQALGLSEMPCHSFPFARLLSSIMLMSFSYLSGIDRKGGQGLTLSGDGVNRVIYTTVGNG